MSRKFWLAAVAIGLTTVSATALADDYRDGNRYDDRYDNRYDDRYDDRYGSDYEYARVVGVEPLRRRIRVSEPVRECWEERGDRYDDNRYDSYRSDGGPFSSNHVGGTLLGGLIGGALGNQVGHGDGRQVAKAAGAIIGGAIGYNASRDRQRQRYSDDGYYYGDDRYQQRCETRYRDDYEERVDGYEVTYEYAGRHYVTRMPYDPGERIRIRVDVTPTGG